MDDERKSSKAGERAAEGLREATAKEEAKTRARRGTIWLRALIASKNALKAPMEKAQKKNRKGEPIQQTRRGVSVRSSGGEATNSTSEKVLRASAPSMTSLRDQRSSMAARSGLALAPSRA